MFSGFSLNIFAVLVCTVVNMVLGGLWYSSILFGNVWLKLIGKKAEEISKEEGNKAMGFAVIPAIVTAFGLALITGLTGAATIVDALIIGSLISLVFVGMSSLNLVLFEQRSIKLTLLNVGYPFVSMNIAAIILTFWK